MDVQFQLREAVADQPQHGGQQVGRDGRDDAEVQRPGERAAGGLDLLGEGLQRGEHPACVLAHALTQGVIITLRVVRSTSCAPSDSSSAATAPDRAGWLVPVAAAASRKCRCSATARKALSWATVGARGLRTVALATAASGLAAAALRGRGRDVGGSVLIAISDQTHQV